MGMSPGFQQGAVAIVEMKVERQLLWRQKFNGHPFFPFPQ
jgi:hypothetical protein